MASRPTRVPVGERKAYRMRERCRPLSWNQCIRYVVSYPRLSRMTRRKGTDLYRRLTGLAGAGAAFFAAAFFAGAGAAAVLAAFFATGFGATGFGAIGFGAAVLGAA